MGSAIGFTITVHDKGIRDNPAPVAAMGIGADIVGLQEFKVKVRELAVALVELEHLSGVPAERPGVADPIAPNESARKAARLLWTAMTDGRRQQRS